MYKFFLFLCFPIFMFSQKQKMEGTIVNSQNEKLSLVSVEVYSSQNILLKTLITNENGGFTLENISEKSVKTHH